MFQDTTNKDQFNCIRLSITKARASSPNQRINMVDSGCHIIFMQSPVCMQVSHGYLPVATPQAE